MIALRLKDDGTPYRSKDNAFVFIKDSGSAIALSDSEVLEMKAILDKLTCSPSKGDNSGSKGD